MSEEQTDIWIGFMVTVALAFFLELTGFWQTMVVAGFFGGIIARSGTVRSALIGFLAVAMTWLYLYLATSVGSIFGGLLGLLSMVLGVSVISLLAIGVIIGGILGALGGALGSLALRVFVKNKKH